MCARFLSLALGVVLCSGSLSAGEPKGTDVPNSWTQWRGPDRTGMIPDANWPTDLKGLTPIWTKPLQPSYSGPLVSGNVVYTTETRNRESEVVTAFDRTTGEVIWETDWKGAITVPFFAMANGSWIRSTPALGEDDRLFIGGIRDLLVCLNAETGEVLWRVNFVEQFSTKVPGFGFVASPLPMGDKVYVQAGASFACVDAATGRVLWRTLTSEAAGGYDSAFSSPVVATLHGKQQLVVQTRKLLAGVDPETGSVLWSTPVEAFRDMNILTPTVVGNKVFTSTYQGGSFLFEVTKTGDDFGVKSVWKNKVQAYMSSPVAIDGHIYLHLRNKRFACIDVETGKEAWITTPFGKYWSLVASGDKILALDERGILYLVKANPEKFELLDERKVSEESTWAHLAIVGDELFIRELKALSVHRWNR